MEEKCSSCGASAKQLKVVKRVYLELDPFDHCVISQIVLDEPESWCASCVSSYPHVAQSDQDSLNRD